jgi:hypothetical protein
MVACFLLWIIPTALVVQGFAVPGLKTFADLALVVSTAASSFGLTAIFMRFGARPMAAFDGLSANAYGIYLTHYLFVVWLQYILLGLALFAIAKAGIVFGGALLLSWAATVAICRHPLGSRLIGEGRAMPKERRPMAKAG